jgi:hypothetical protein
MQRRSWRTPCPGRRRARARPHGRSAARRAARPGAPHRGPWQQSAGRRRFAQPLCSSQHSLDQARRFLQSPLLDTPFPAALALSRPARQRTNALAVPPPATRPGRRRQTHPALTRLGAGPGAVMAAAVRRATRPPHRPGLPPLPPSPCAAGLRSASGRARARARAPRLLMGRGERTRPRTPLPPPRGRRSPSMHEKGPRGRRPALKRGRHPPLGAGPRAPPSARPGRGAPPATRPRTRAPPRTLLSSPFWYTPYVQPLPLRPPPRAQARRRARPAVQQSAGPSPPPARPPARPRRRAAPRDAPDPVPPLTWDGAAPPPPRPRPAPIPPRCNSGGRGGGGGGGRASLVCVCTLPHLLPPVPSPLVAAAPLLTSP